jgi:hypothetical protein
VRVVGQIDINNALAKLDMSRNGVRPAVARALNKTGTTGRAQASRSIQAAGYNMKAGDIKAAITLPRRASSGNLNLELRARGKPIPLIQFAARATKSGVSVNVKNGRRLLSHAFIATMPSGHRGVFQRVGRMHKRVVRDGRRLSTGLPIKELFGPSIKAAFASEPVKTDVINTMRERFPIVLVQELRFEALR